MATTAKRREQLEKHLEQFREIADQRNKERIARWVYHIPAMVSVTILICQIANTIIFADFAFDFGKLYLLIDDYMLKTAEYSNSSGFSGPKRYSIDTIYHEWINEIDQYHELLWTLFVAEVIQLVFPIINLFIFAWIFHDRSRKFNSKIKVIYLLCPALALALTVSQACMIHVSLDDSVYTIRFLLAKLISPLLEVNREGRYDIEQYFNCEFFNDDNIVKPPCAGSIHDQVLSPSIINTIIVFHVIPIVVFVYLILRNLANNKTERLFLYIESVDEYGVKPVTQNGDTKDKKEDQEGLKAIVSNLLNEYDVHFKSKKSMVKQKSISGEDGKENHETKF
uniref:G protein-coupled receptor n=1 Tax=Steinernema glaseri TaxID=37863 RepID=A0A1I8AB54_9BILA